MIPLPHVFPCIKFIIWVLLMTDNLIVVTYYSSQLPCLYTYPRIDSIGVLYDRNNYLPDSTASGHMISQLDYLYEFEKGNRCSSFKWASNTMYFCW